VDGTLTGARGRPGADLAFDGAAGALRFTALSPLRRQRARPEAKLDALLAPLRPVEATVAPLDAAAAAGGAAGDGAKGGAGGGGDWGGGAAAAGPIAHQPRDPNNP
jgi:hypothetical protein